jgi:hypothetical protein
MADNFTLPSKTPAIIIVFPVKSSPPARTTNIKPVPKIAPARTLPSPYVSGFAKRLNAAMLEPSEAKAINTPAKMPSKTIFMIGVFAFFIPVSITTSVISKGVK